MKIADYCCWKVQRSIVIETYLRSLRSLPLRNLKLLREVVPKELLKPTLSLKHPVRVHALLKIALLTVQV